MNPVVFAELVVAASNLALAVYVLAHRPRNVVHRSFFLFGAGIAFWAGSIACLSITRNFFFAAAALYGGHLMMLGLFMLAVTFPDEKIFPRERLWALVPIAVVTILTPFGLFIRSVQFSPMGGPVPENGALFPLLVGVTLFYLIFSAYLFAKQYRASQGIGRVRMRYLIFGAGIFIGAMFLFDLLLPSFGIFGFNLIGPLASIIFTALTAYSIVRHRFLNIRIVIQRGLLYACAIAMLGILFFGIYFFLQIFIKDDRLDEFIDVLAAAIGAFAFPRFRCAFEKATDPIFFRGGYDYAVAVGALSPLLASTLDLRTLVDSIKDFLARTVRPANVLFAFQGEDESAVLHGVRGQSEMRRLKEGCLMLVEIASGISDDVILAQELDAKDEQESRRRALSLMRKLEIAAIVPLFSKEGVRSFLFVGEKLSGDIMRPDDIRLFGILSHQAGMAIENSRLYEKIRVTNEGLERRVIEKTEKLKAMYDVQSRFLADISHELQTPVAILQGNLEIVEGGTDRERKNAARVARTTLSGMSTLINNLMEVARLNFSKNKLHKSQLSVERLLQEVSDDCFVLAVNKGISLSVKAEKFLIYGERRKLKEVLLNLINNALNHTRPGGSIFLRAVMTPGGPEVIVEDTGVGIAPKDVEKIFDRFYRIKGEASRGSGLGLNICRQIIEAHGGAIRVESEVGKGSKFIIALPAAQKDGSRMRSRI